MTLLRAAYRTMLASYFISSGVKAVRNPAPLAPLAEPLADKLVPFVKKYAPSEVAGYVPEDPKTLVRLNGALQIAGGLALATGRGRRVGALLLAGSLIPSTLAKYPFWSQSGEEAAASRSHFAKNVSILGGVLLASRDTEGKPGIAWRAQAGGHAIAKSTSRTTKKLTHSGAGDKLAKQAGQVGDAVSDVASDVASKTSDLAGAAVAGGVALLGAAEVATRGTRKKARKQFKVAQVTAAKQAKVTGKRLAEQAKEAQKVAVKQAGEAKKIAAARAEEAREAAQKAAKQAKKDAKKRGAKAVKSTKKVGRHIQLGEN
ncbi:hypothetical protein GCM10022197_08070 [Microlunatus spumicola]|uniref:DoxX protein n=1 Tax=Microlunatus spumicola TaxID=81499 RepID=A0ABP6WQW6_9ACTN